MNVFRIMVSHTRLIGCLLALVVLGACRESTPADLPGDPVRGLDAEAVTLVAGAAARAAGERVVIALQASSREAENAPAAFSGVLEWPADRYRWIGQIAAPGRAALVNSSDAAGGVIRFAGFADDGVDALALFVLEAVRAGSPSVVSLSALYASGSGVRSLSDLRARDVASLPDPSLARELSLADWMALFDPPTAPGGGPQRVPGEGVLFGDPTVDGIIDARDALYVANMAVSNTLFAECMLRTDVVRRDCIAANVAPANLPGLGESTDLCPPGLEACSGYTRVIDARDVLIIRREAVGIDGPIAGEPIPLPTVSGDTVPLLSVTGPRVLSADTVYRLTGLVEVGTDGAAGVSGELVIAPGTRIVADLDAGLVVSRNGRIVADGTAFQPITFDCVGVGIPGCWRGIRIHGNALVNTGTPASSPATARTSGGCVTGFAPAGEGTYGGCADADDSGVLRFVRVLNAGATSGGGVELRGVGSGTQIRQLYVTASSSDGVSVLGGTVALRELRIQVPGGRGFRWSEGWRGNLQYLAVQSGNDTDIAIEGASSTASGATPRSAPALRNVTLVAAPDVDGGSSSSAAIRLLSGTGGSLRNFLVLGQPEQSAYMLDIDGGETWNEIVNGTLVFDSSLVAGYGQLGEQDADPAGLGALFSTDAEGQYIRTTSLGNRVVHEFALQDSVLRGAYATVPDLRPVPGGVVSSTICGTGLPPFDPAPFCGALEPPDMSLGLIPWMEPAPLVGTVAVPVSPTPGFATILVLGTSPTGGQFPLPGVLLGSGVIGATGPDGRYRTYVRAEADGGGVNGFILTVSSLPPHCSNPGPTISVGPPSGEEQVFGVLVQCN